MLSFVLLLCFGSSLTNAETYHITYPTASRCQDKLHPTTIRVTAEDAADPCLSACINETTRIANPACLDVRGLDEQYALCDRNKTYRILDTCVGGTSLSCDKDNNLNKTECESDETNQTVVDNCVCPEPAIRPDGTAAVPGIVWAVIVVMLLVASSGLLYRKKHQAN